MHTEIICSQIQARKTTSIRLTAVEETGVPRHHEGLVKGPLKPIGLKHHYHIEWFKGSL